MLGLRSVLWVHFGLDLGNCVWDAIKVGVLLCNNAAASAWVPCRAAIGIRVEAAKGVYATLVACARSLSPAQLRIILAAHAAGVIVLTWRQYGAVFAAVVMRSIPSKTEPTRSDAQRANG